MTDRAAIAGTFADIKTVRTRGVGQIVVEFPIERYAEVVNMFGAPTGETWLAVARMEDQPVEQEEKPRRPFSELPRSQQAALCCQDEGFQGWVRVKAPYLTVQHRDLERAARQYVLDNCRIASRAMLDDAHFGDALECWDKLYQQYCIETGRMAEPR